MAKQKVTKSRGWTDEQKKEFGEKMKASRKSKTVVIGAAENTDEQMRPEAQTLEYVPVQTEQVKEEQVITEPLKPEIMSETEVNPEIAALKEALKQQQEATNLLMEQFKQLQKGQSSASAPMVISPEIFKQTDRAKTKFGGTLRKEIPADDRLDMLKTYIHVGGMFVMNVYIKDGSEVYAPYETEVSFKPFNSEFRNGQWYTYSTFSTYSKKECAFIENSPMYGFSIFSKVKDAQKVDPELVQKVAEAADIVNKYSQIQLINAAQSYNINTSGLSNDQIRQQLQNFKLAEILQREQESETQKLKSLYTHEIAQKQL